MSSSDSYYFLEEPYESIFAIFLYKCFLTHFNKSPVVHIILPYQSNFNKIVQPQSSFSIIITSYFTVPK